MLTEAAKASFYDSPWGKKYPRLQVRTDEEQLAGKGLDMRLARQVNVTIKKVRRVGDKKAVALQFAI